MINQKKYCTTKILLPNGLGNSFKSPVLHAWWNKWTPINLVYETNPHTSMSLTINETARVKLRGRRAVEDNWCGILALVHRTFYARRQCLILKETCSDMVIETWIS